MSLEDLFELTGMERKRKFDFKLIGYIVCIFVYRGNFHCTCHDPFVFGQSIAMT